MPATGPKDYPEKEAALENIANIKGSGNMAIAGNGNNVNGLTDKFIDLLKKKDEQIDRLLGLLETKSKEGRK